MRNAAVAGRRTGSAPTGRSINGFDRSRRVIRPKKNRYVPVGAVAFDVCDWALISYFVACSLQWVETELERQGAAISRSPAVSFSDWEVALSLYICGDSRIADWFSRQSGDSRSLR